MEKIKYRGVAKGRKSYIRPMFSAKRIILDAVRDRLKSSGVSRLVLVFNVLNDEYNVMVKNKDNSNLKLDIEKNEITMIKKIFVNRIQRKFEETSNKDIKAIIIQIDLELDIDDAISIFIQDVRNEVEKFIY